MVACRPDDTASHFRDHPCVLVGVMSATTERTNFYINRPLFTLLTQISLNDE